jgi:HSP20 family protein
MTKHFLPDIFGRQPGTDIFSTLQREIDQVFNNFGRNWPMATEVRDGLWPVKFNMAETDKTVEITADMPGVDAKDIDVQLREGILTIRGEKKAEKEDKQKDYHLMERSYGMFERAFTLPADVMDDKVDASFDKGVLKIVLPKAPDAQSKVKKITVKGAV